MRRTSDFETDWRDRPISFRVWLAALMATGLLANTVAGDSFPLQSVARLEYWSVIVMMVSFPVGLFSILFLRYVIYRGAAPERYVIGNVAEFLMRVLALSFATWVFAGGAIDLAVRITSSHERIYQITVEAIYTSKSCRGYEWNDPTIGYTIHTCHLSPHHPVRQLPAEPLTVYAVQGPWGTRILSMTRTAR